ncbi:MAG TPA: chorismate mutase [Solirubrobacteraceae bacterium]|jgi:chorismate mutase|nr:chorismate mutase [Solirubrobacteraceae bacterium]
MRLFALRGAITTERNDRAEILAATDELLREIMRRNELAPSDVVSCLFTATEDLDAEFPAVAARGLGFELVPLICAREIPVPGSLPRVIRLLMHYHGAEDHTPAHVYLRGAIALRADRGAAQ